MKYFKYLLLLIPFLSFAHGDHGHYSHEELSKVSRLRIFTTPSQIKSLQENGMSIDHGVWRSDIYFECEVFEKDLALLALTTTQYEITYKDANDYYAERNLLFKNAKDPAGTCKIDDGLEGQYVVPENFNYGSFAGFYTYDELIGHLDNMADKYPDLITVKAPIDTFKTHQGRDIFWMKMSDNPYQDESTSEQQVLYTALHHSREPMSMMQLVFSMYYLLENYDKDPIIKSIVDGHELYFVPCLNPDGYNLDQEFATQTGNNTNFAYWRKNGRDNDENGVINENDGVDLNRNYDFYWGLDNNGSSPNIQSQTYRGPSPASEPETQAINWLCRQNDFVMALNCHSYSNILIHPWAYIPFDPTPDSTLFRTIGKALTIDNEYAVGTGDELLGYSVNGDSDDWMYGDSTKNKILAFTPEVGSGADGFYPPQERIVPLCLGTLLQNINTVRCLNNYAYPTLIEEDITDEISTIEFEILQAGLQAAPLNIKFDYVNGNSTYENYELDLLFSETENISLLFYPDDNLTANDEIGVIMTFEYEDGINEEFKFLWDYPGEAANNIDTFVNYEDDGTSFENWTTSNSWGLTEELSYSPPSSYTDSEGGSYSPGVNSVILNEVIDLTEAGFAELNFWCRWQIEANYDYLQIFAVDVESGAKTSLCGEYTKTGDNFYLTSDEPYYDSFQYDWVEETIDLSSFLGKEIQIEFYLFADQFVEEDGFYFDDIRIITDVESESDIEPEVQRGSIGDFVFNDTNKDGLQSEGEEGIDGVSVFLFDADNTIIPLQTTTTANGGLYEFLEVDISINYILGFETPIDFEPTIYGDGASTGNPLDSDLNPDNGLTEAITLTDGDFNRTIDAGFSSTLIEPTSMSNAAISFNLYPNPADKIINFDLADLRGDNLIINITNIEGKLIKSIPLTSLDKSIIQTDVSELSDGLFFCQLYDGNVLLKTSKLIIAH